MSHEIKQDGTGNFAFQGIYDSNFNIFISKSDTYRELIDTLKFLEGIFIAIPESQIQKRLEISIKIEEQTRRIEAFKQDVLTLAEAFNKIDINTERLRIAKKFFEDGKYQEASTILQSELEQIKIDQDKLLDERKKFEAEIIPKLEHNSEEFLILALTMPFGKSKKDRFDKTCECFERSILSYETRQNLFLYAQFLAFHNHITRAKEYWKECLKKFEMEMSLGEKVEILNNIALAYSYQDEYEDAIVHYQKALILARTTYIEKPLKRNHIRLGFVLNNVGLLQTNFKKNDEAGKNLFEALQIRKTLLKQNDYESMDNLATTHVNLGLLFRNEEKYDKAEFHYVEALKIYESEGKRSLFHSLHQISLIKNNLGDLYCRKGKLPEAEEKYNEALEIINNIFSVAPLMVLPEAVLVFSNLATFYQTQKTDREKSIDFAFQALILASGLFDEISMIQEEFFKTRNVLINWGYCDEDIAEIIDNTIKDRQKIGGD